MERKNWTREELILAFNLYLKLPFHKTHHNNTDVINLAQNDKFLFLEDINSYLQKIFQNRIKNEEEIFGSYKEKSNREEGYEKIYKTVNNYFQIQEKQKIDINNMFPNEYSSKIGYEIEIELSEQGELDTTCIIF